MSGLVNVSKANWLINKCAADLDITTEQLEQDSGLVSVIQKYIVCEIETYEELLKTLYEVKAKKNG